MSTIKIVIDHGVAASLGRRIVFVGHYESLHWLWTEMTVAWERVRRIVIVGNAGSGKSTLARRLGECMRLPVIHLDALRWEPGWRPASNDTLRIRLSAALSQDGWITDGNYAACTFDLRLPRADLVIWIESWRLHCLCRVVKRALRSRFRTDQHLAPGCPERFDRRFLDRLRFIVNFNRVNRPIIEAERAKYGPDVPVVVLRGHAAISRLLDSAEAAHPPVA
jgi:adenylate kinase family enzyme